MKNPYEDYEAHPDEAHIGRGFAWCAVVVFFLLVTVPPVWRNAYEIALGDEGTLPVVELFRFDSSKDNTLYQHLRTVEGQFEDAAFTDPPRRNLQGALSAVFREGNRKAVIGKDGWLFFKPAIDALIGYGPLKPEPDTVAKDPSREPWEGPLGAITRFAEQLDSYGVELVLVPIPVKPMIYPEQLGGGEVEEPLRHRDAAAFYDKLRASKVQVLDLADELFALKESDTQVFLKQDTHWTPAGMKASAEGVAAYLKARPWFGEAGAAADFASGPARDIEAPGDLVEKLDLPDASRIFGDETAVAVTTVVGDDGEPVSIYDEASSVVLLGDSFTNIYSMKSMGWGENAGFAQHLTAELGMTIDTIAQNGQASTGVRKTLASRPGAAATMRQKKVVVWAIAARDLFLSETAAREAQVRWDDVEFSTKAVAAPPADPATSQWPVKLRARMTMKSSFAHPDEVAYPDALYASEYEIVEVIEGAFPDPTALIFHWAFRQRKLLPSSDYQEGEERVLTVRPFSEMTDLQSVNQANDSFDPDLQILWADEKAEPANEDASSSEPETSGDADADTASVAAGSSSAIRSASLVAGIYALALIGVFAAVARRRLRQP